MMVLCLVHKMMFLMLAIITNTEIVQGFCRDEIAYKGCELYKSLGLCEAKEYKPVLAKKCPMSCNLCDFGLVKVVKCIDKEVPENCKYLKKVGACKSHKSIMAYQCAQTCNLCETKKKCANLQCAYNEVCELDKNNNAVCVCPSYCPNEKGYAKLGQVCGSDLNTYQNVCQLQHSSCTAKHNITVINYGICKGQEPCEDAKAESKRGLCKSWKSLNLCGYGDMMKMYCKRTCGYCHPEKVPHPQLRGPCENSKYGCCWDLSDKPAPPADCPDCEDAPFCKHFLEQCNSIKKKNNSFIKRHCPAMCGFCIPDKQRKLAIKVTNHGGKQSLRVTYKH